MLLVVSTVFLAVFNTFNFETCVCENKREKRKFKRTFQKPTAATTMNSANSKVVSAKVGRR